MADLEVKIAKLEVNYANIKETLERVECKLDSLAVDFQKFGGLYSEQVKVNDRLSNLEKFADDFKNWRTKILVVGATIISILTIGWNILGDFIKEKLGF
jgi:hypothetical protein